MRQIGQYGRLPALLPVGLAMLPTYAAPSLPTPPPSVEPPSVPWGMLGNDTYGDCGVAGLQHLLMADASMTHETVQWPTSQEVVRYYLNYTQGNNSGVVLSQFLAYVRRNGYPNGQKVTAYAPISPQDVESVRVAIASYGGAYSGIVVTQGMEAAFRNGTPWDLDATYSEPAGGHCVPLVGYDSSYLYAVTWGAIQPVAFSAWHRIAEESWAVITGELSDGDGRGLSASQLLADLDKL